MAKKKTDERNGENVDGDEPNFEDPENFVDDISDQGASSSIPHAFIRFGVFVLEPGNNLFVHTMYGTGRSAKLNAYYIECNYSMKYVCQHGVLFDYM